MFGIEDDENFGLLNKVSSILQPNYKTSKNAIPSQLNVGSQTIKNENSFIKENKNKFRLDLNTINDAAFPNNLSKIEITNHGNDNLLSTERFLTLSDKRAINKRGFP
jgi:5-methylcytosine-specific restriction endonuclease McrBC regulatory subunit McrC